jgi:hypothetical protein
VRSHDLNRLLDEPGPERDRASQKIAFWKPPRLSLDPKAVRLIARFIGAIAAADA